MATADQHRQLAGILLLLEYWFSLWLLDSISQTNRTVSRVGTLVPATALHKPWGGTLTLKHTERAEAKTKAGKLLRHREGCNLRTIHHFPPHTIMHGYVLCVSVCVQCADILQWVITGWTYLLAAHSFCSWDKASFSSFRLSYWTKNSSSGRDKQKNTEQMIRCVLC